MSIDIKPDVVNICRQLIQTQSLSGTEGALVEKLKLLYDELGIDDVFVDEYGSITACIRGKWEGPTLLFDAHIDTVPVSDASKWKHSPFDAQIEDGRIYGRGASDMKGALAAMIVAAAKFKKNNGKNFNGEIYISGVVHEECFEGVAARMISRRINPDIVVIGEASELNLKCGQRGRSEIVVETYGKPAHSANPEKGINAVYKMMQLIGEINKLPTPTHEVLGRGILELTDIISSPYPGASVVPDYCKATFDRRLLPGESPSEVLAPIKKIIEDIERQDAEFRAAVSIASASEKCHTGSLIQGERFFPAWLFDQESDFITKIMKGLHEIGVDVGITQYSFCTNGSHYAGEAGIKTIGFGPSRENLAHVIDEYVEIEQLELASKGYEKIMRVFLCD